MLSLFSPPGTGLNGYIDWSLSNFTLQKLADGMSFPAFSAQELEIYDNDGNVLTRTRDGIEQDVLYLPYVDFNCLIMEAPELEPLRVAIAPNETRLNIEAILNITGEDQYVISGCGYG